MVDVSERFMALAQDNGRHVYCKIEAGAQVFLDDRITGFELDDVAHPDWFTLGTTCANRFYFTARCSGGIAVNDAVRPFISFDGQEWCPLGVFYVARRYVRGNNASIVCYDRFYGLDRAYSCGAALPCGSDELLRDICTQYGITCADYGAAHEVSALPESATVRDMIGYIAALNRACARFDRQGALTLKTCDMTDFTLSDRNCFDIARNMSRSVITCVKADTGGEVLTAGSGAEISTLELYNPLMTGKRVNTLLSLLRPFAFYGAQIEMQGLPFIEAGDTIRLSERGEVFPIVVSEVEYRYDGGLTAVLYSKNRSYTDAVVHEDDLANALKDLESRLSAMYLKHANDAQLAIGETPADCAVFEFNAAGETFAQLDVNLTVSNSTADDLIIDVYVNGVRTERRAVHHFAANGEKPLLHFYYLADALPKGQNTVRVQLSTKSGSAYILPGQLLATIVAHGIAAGGGASHKRALSEIFGAAVFSNAGFTPAEATDSVLTKEE